MSLDIRGDKIGISQAGNYKVITAARSYDGRSYDFRAKEGLREGGPPLVLTIAPTPCRDEFSGERTRITAWLDTPPEPRNLRSCAAPAK